METEVSAVGILDLIRKPATTSQEMKSKLERLRSADPASAGRELELRRKRLLFEGNDKDLDRIEAEIAQNLRNQERYDVAVAELEKQIAQAELEENNAALTAQREAAAAARETSATQIAAAAKSLDAAVRTLGGAFNRLRKAIPAGAVDVPANPDVNYLVCLDDPKSSVALARSFSPNPCARLYRMRSVILEE
jgi:septal ring factor EnvC (AmiA/AmiB activator)